MNSNRFLFGATTVSILLGCATIQANIVFNEVLASNESYPINDSTSDWVELYNTDASNSVDLTGVRITLSNSDGTSKNFTFPEGATISPKGYYIIACDSGEKSSILNTGFNIPSTGATLKLYDSSGTSPIDTLDFGPQLTDYSVGRVTDGTGKFVLCIPTLGNANQAQTMGTIASIKINEVSAASDPDWFELYNSGSYPVDIGGYYLTRKPKKDPLMFPIPVLTFIGIGADAYLVYYADQDTTAGKNHVNFKLAKEADNIAIMKSSSSTINLFEYPDMADNEAYGRVPDGGNTILKQPNSGTPEASNYQELQTVVISEILSHTDYPDTPPDFIELQNISQSAVDISGWGLSDSRKNFMKYIFPTGTVIQPGGFLVVTDFEFNDESNPNCQTPFRLNSYEGDNAYLTQAISGKQTGYRCQLHFGAAPNNFSFIRTVNSDGIIRYPLAEYPTMDATNAPVKIGPIVINEIHYKPAGTTEPTEDEFIEIFNITDKEVEMFYPGYPENPPKIANGVEYTFPKEMKLGAGSYALIVSFNPSSSAATSFRQKFNVPDDVVLYGPYSGKLSNDGETVELLFPDKPEGKDSGAPGLVPYYVEDSVTYSATAPWPANAKGTGRSLQRVNAFLYGDQSANWNVFPGTDTVNMTTAGRRSSIGATDQDSDLMPDDWELHYQFDPFDPADANEDANGDGITNLQHYLNGTNPREQKVKTPVEITAVLLNDTIQISFTALANNAYEVQVSDNSETGWTVWQEVDSGDERKVEFTDSLLNNTRYYRVLTK